MIYNLRVCVLLFLLVFSPACNFPGFAFGQTGLSPKALRQTIEAQSQATSPGASPEPEGTRPSSISPLLSPFPGLATGTPEGNPSTEPVSGHNPDDFQYVSRSGDTLAVIASRFGVEPKQISSAQSIPPESFIPLGQLLDIPNTIGQLSYPSAVLPDSEVINSPSTIGFNIQELVSGIGFLSTYAENVSNQRISGVDIVRRVALESSVNPRFLLAFLEYRSGWVSGQPVDPSKNKYPIGFHVSGWDGLYKELVISATHLNAGYYGWRAAKVTNLVFQDGSSVRISPQLNPGSVAVQYLFSKLYTQDDWRKAIYDSDGFLDLYQQMFGDPWIRGGATEPLFPDGLVQPELELPFTPGERWSLTGGPHPSWKTGSPPGALDLAPVTGELRCAVSRAWVTASASGLIVRSERNVVIIDLDGDGHEQTGWNVLYMHIADAERVSSGAWLEVDDPIGHPSCEGGTSTGIHVHIARKYNGEWIAADGPLPFVLSGWVAYAGKKDYLGELKKGDQVAVASPVGPRTSIVIR